MSDEKRHCAGCPGWYTATESERDWRGYEVPVPVQVECPGLPPCEKCAEKEARIAALQAELDAANKHVEIARESRDVVHYERDKLQAENTKLCSVAEAALAMRRLQLEFAKCQQDYNDNQDLEIEERIEQVGQEWDEAQTVFENVVDAFAAWKETR